ncbi:hypothetical protein KFK09_012993 [Dendrobium nobile]|uniref:Uncharacterized protein n=1 Tax=Dendrobium nobile TaxID=94219 RepID=A0A8T3BIY1_DENNO|nr:hypothetical protein KFK09_012993 [Dendrobium nobile]
MVYPTSIANHQTSELHEISRRKEGEGKISKLPCKERGLGKPREGLNSKDRGRREEGGISGLPCQERGLEKSRKGLNSKDKGRREEGGISGLPCQERGLRKPREGLNSKDRGRREEGGISGLPCQERGLGKPRECLNSKDRGRREEGRISGLPCQERGLEKSREGLNIFLYFARVSVKFGGKSRFQFGVKAGVFSGEVGWKKARAPDVYVIASRGAVIASSDQQRDVSTYFPARVRFVNERALWSRALWSRAATQRPVALLQRAATRCLYVFPMECIHAKITVWREDIRRDVP